MRKSYRQKTVWCCKENNIENFLLKPYGQFTRKYSLKIRACGAEKLYKKVLKNGLYLSVYTIQFARLILYRLGMFVGGSEHSDIFFFTKEQLLFQFQLPPTNMEEHSNSIIFELYTVRIENFSLLLWILQNTRFHPIKNDYCTVITFLIRISLLEQLAKEGRMEEHGRSNSKACTHI